MAVMKLAQFRYDLPEKLIAQSPPRFRDEGRMMVVHRESQKIEHKTFKDLVKYFGEGDVFVVNNAKVFNARLWASKERTGGKIEVFLLRELNKELRLWDVLVDPARKIRVGNKLFFGENEELVAEVVDNTTSRGRTLRFLYDGTNEELWKLIENIGEPPLPKYITRPVEKEDKERYQTIFAKEGGAVQAPSAGLHFSREMKLRMEIKGISFADLTLVAGLSSFRQVEVEDLTKHKMDSEKYIISDECAGMVNKALDNKKKVCAVGCTTLRAMESSVSAGARLNPNIGWTDRFIYPPYKFKLVDTLLTNFHQPESTLLMLLTAYLGYDFTFHCYQQAIKEKYKFLTFGDCMLIL